MRSTRFVRQAFVWAAALYWSAASIAHATVPTGVAFVNFSSTTVTLTWTLDTPSSESPLVVLSTMSNFSVVTASATGALGLQTTTYAVADNSTYYFKVKVSTEVDANYSAAISSLTAAAAPAGIVFDEISAGSITASAYAMTPAFSSMSVGASGINVASSPDGSAWTWAGWRVGDVWTGKASMPTQRYVQASAAVGGRIYVIGGAYAGIFDTNEEYDPVTNIWTTRASMPTARAYLAATAVDGKIYALGGQSVLIANSVLNEVYDPVRNAWMTKAPMPTGRYALAAAAVGGKIYAIGGAAGLSYLQNNEQYDPVLDQWTVKAVMTTGRDALAAAVVGDKIYAIGGYVSGVHGQYNESYDPSTNVWTTKASMPTGRSYLAAAVLGGKVYALGGQNGPILNINEEYDTVSNSWAARKNIPTQRYGLSAVALRGRIYAIGGHTGAIWNGNEMYDPGFASTFTALSPNTQYFFKAKARNSAGVESVESPVVSTYTLAAVGTSLYTSTFTNLTGTSLTLNWSSGTPGAFNPAGTWYLAELSTTANFSAVWSSSLTLNASADFTALNTGSYAYYGRVTALNLQGAANRIYLGATSPSPAASIDVATFTAITPTGFTVNWSSGTAATGYSPAGTLYRLDLAKASGFTAIYASSLTYNISASFSGLPDNSTWYARVAIQSGGDLSTPFYSLGYATTTISVPTGIYFDAISTSAIAVSAYAATPGFSNLDQGVSGVNVTRDGTWTDFGWRSGNRWTAKANMGTARYSLGAASIGGKVYAVGGYSGSASLQTNEQYDPVTNLWTSMASMPTARYGVSAAVSGGKVFAIGGYNGVYLQTNQAYDPYTNSWSTAAAMPTARFFPGAVTVGGVIYVFGGATLSVLSVNEAYDPDADAWTTKANMPTARYAHASAATGGKIYALGGLNNGGGSLAVNEEYDPAVNAWTTKTAMPTLRNSLAAASIGGKVYAFNGINNSYTNANEEYDPSANTWTARADSSLVVSALAAAAVNGKIYTMGGVLWSTAQSATAQFDPGVTSTFSALSPNTQYSFKAKARDSFGLETAASSTISTYTLAAVAGVASTFTAVQSDSITVAWAAGPNPTGVRYLVQASTVATFMPVYGSSNTANTSAMFSGLASLTTTYYFRVKAANVVGSWGDYLTLGSTSNVVTPASVANLAVAQDGVIWTSSLSWITVTWTGPGDNYNTGAPQAGSVYDLRWSTFALTSEAAWASASYRSTFSAAGAPLSAQSKSIGVTAGKTWYFGVTTTNSGATRSGLSNSPSIAAQQINMLVTDVSTTSILQGQTTAFLAIQLWTDAGSAFLRTLSVGKMGTLPDGAVQRVAIYKDNNGNGIFDDTTTDPQTSNSGVFVSSRATLTLAGGSGQLVNTTPATYYLAVTFNPTSPIVAGSTIALFLDGQAFTVMGGGVQAPDYPGLSFNGTASVTASYRASLNLTTALTVEAWFRSTSTVAQTLVYRGAAFSGGYDLVMGACAVGKIGFYAGTGPLRCSNNTYNDGRWHHAAGTNDPVLGESLFMDGLQVSTWAPAVGLGDSSSVFQVGQPPSDGDIDEVRVSTFARYTGSFIPDRRFNPDAGTVLLWHFGADSSTAAIDAGPLGINGAFSGPGVTGAGRSSSTAIIDVQDVMWSSMTDIVAGNFVRSGANMPVAKLKLWTNSDLVVIDKLYLERTGTGADSDVSAVRIFLDNGDGVFNAVTDTSLLIDHQFTGTKSTFDFAAAGMSQTIGTSTKTYFVAWDISPSAGAANTLGLRLATTDQFVLNGTTDTVSAVVFPFASGLYPIDVSASNVTTYFPAGAWLNSSSVVFRGAFGVGNTDHYRYIWNQTPVTSVGLGDTLWSVGFVTMTATTDAANWYFHVRGYDLTDTPGAQQDLGPFWIDTTSPTASAFQSVSSSGGAMGASQWNDLAVGVTVQMTVSDALSGLAISSSALAFAGDGHDGQSGSAGYGVMYTTNAGQNWVNWSTYTATLSGLGGRVMAVFNGKIYTGGSGAHIFSSPDGATWTQVYTAAGEIYINALSVFNGKLYAGTSPSGKIYSSPDGTTWTQVLSTGESAIYSLATFNGKLYAGTDPNGKIYSSADGATWTTVFSGAGEVRIWSLAAFNGRLYAGTQNAAAAHMYSSADGVTWTLLGLPMDINSFRVLSAFSGKLYAGTGEITSNTRIYSSADGVTWTQVLSGTGETGIYSLSAFNGKLYAGTYPNAKVYSSPDGVTWKSVLSGTGETHILGLSAFNGKLYAGTYPTGEVFQMSPLTTALTGTDGTNGSQTLSATSLNFVTSTNSVVCGGTGSCGATNQVIFSASDMSGNVRTAGPFSVLVDSGTPLAVSTPSAPSGLISQQPSFDWVGPSTGVVSGMAGTYLLQVAAAADPTFASPVISISTPAVVASTMQSVGTGVYLSTYTLAEGSYLWRVQAISQLGLHSPWSATASFTLDLTTPVASGFVSVNGSNVATTEAQWNDLAVGVTVQMTVSDAFTGLAISTYSLPSLGEGHSGPSAAGGYGVMYTSNAGVNWVNWSSYTATLSGVGANAIWALSQFNGKLYAASNGGSGLYSSVDGTNWGVAWASQVLSLAKFNGKLYAGMVGTGKIYSSPDGTTWTQVLVTGETHVYTLAVFNGKLYAGTAFNGKIYSSADGVTWTQVLSGTGETYFISLAVHNGTLYAGGGAGGIYSTTDGVNWTLAHAFAVQAFYALASFRGKLYAGSTGGLYSSSDGVNWTSVLAAAVGSLTVFNGDLYAGQMGGALFASVNGTTWRNVLPGTYGIWSLAGYNGELYAGTNAGAGAAAVYRLTPLTVSLTGSDGTTGAQTLAAKSLNFVTSVSSAVCGGTAPCTATNQVIFTASDLAGNIREAGPYAVRVDTGIALAISTPSFPSGFIGQQPNFNWVGPSTGIVAGLPNGSYILQAAAAADPTFTSPVISISTPAVVASTSFPAGTGIYVSTYTLAAGSYIWRVQSVSTFGVHSPWSATGSFTLDLVQPVVTGYATKDAGGTWRGEAEWNNLAVGGTIYMSAVSDALSGLAVSSSALVFDGGGKSGPTSSAGYGVMYTTNAGQSWVNWSTYTAVLAGTNMNALTTFNGKIYANEYVGAKFYSSADGVSWALTSSGVCQAIVMTTFNGKIYAGCNGNGVFSSPDGASWTAASTPLGLVWSLAAYNGKIYAGTGSGQVYASADGITWTSVLSGAGANVRSLAVHNGMLFAGTYSGSGAPGLVYLTTDGVRWTLLSTPSAGESNIQALASYNGKLYAGTFPGGKIYSSADGQSWTNVLSASPGAQINSFISFNGQLYAQGGAVYSSADGTTWNKTLPVGSGAMTSYNGKLYVGDVGQVYQVSPLPLYLSGTDGSNAAQYLSSTGLNFVTSTNATICGGVWPCGATNQIMFSQRDMAGNVTSAGPYAMLVNALSQIAISTPSYPSGFVNLQPNFDWVGPSTSVLAGLPGGSYIMQVAAAADSGFASPVISISTPAVVASTSFPAGTGAYISTYTLAAGSYIWRVQSVSAFGIHSPWSSNGSFTLDLVKPTNAGVVSKDAVGVFKNEAQWNNLASGVTVQLTVQDVLSGLAISSSALAFAGDGHEGPSASAGYGVMYTTNAGQSWVNWSTYTTTLSGTGESIMMSQAVFNGKLYVGTQSNGKIYSTPDGATWTQVLSGTGESQILALSVFNGKLYAGTFPTGKIYSTPDGTTWTQVLSGTGEAYMRSFASFDGKLYVGTQSNGKIYSTSDGTTWTQVLSGTGETSIVSLGAFNGTLYAGTYPNGKIYASANGVTWTQVLSGTAGSSIESMAAFNGKLYAGTYSSGKIYSTPDGSTWTQVLGGLSSIFSLNAFNGKLYAGTSPNGNIYSSADGATWTQVLSGTGETEIWSLASFNGKLYAGTYPNGKIIELTPLTASVTGVDGNNLPQTLAATSLNFVTSTNSTTCGGVWPCGATNQVMFSQEDMAGNVNSVGPWAVLVDSPSAVVTFMSAMGSTGTITVNAANPTTGGIPASNYKFELSPLSDFSGGVINTGFIPQTSYVFSSLTAAATYYARATKLDNTGTAGAPSLVLSTQTIGLVAWNNLANLAPATVAQGTEAPMQRFTLQSPSGTATLRTLRVTRTGGVDADIANARLYLDINANGAYDPGTDTLMGQATFTGGKANIDLGGNAQAIDATGRTFFIVYQAAGLAVVGDSLGTLVTASTDTTFDWPFISTGTFPAVAGSAAVTDVANLLTISTMAVAPTSAPSGAINVPMIGLTATATGGSSIIHSLVAYLSGTLPSSSISSVRVYRDANANGTFDGGDTLVTSGADAFTLGVATLNFTAAQPLRTVAASPVRYFVTVSLSAAANPGDAFTVHLASASEFTLDTPLDTVAFTTAPIVSSTVTVLVSNILTATMSGGAPAVMTQGIDYQVATASLNVNVGLAGVDRVTINRTGVGSDADVASVKIYVAQPGDGGIYNPAVDTLAGSGVFTAGVANVNITTVPVTSGATTVLFIVYAVSPAANAGDTLGAGFSNPTYLHAASPLTTVAGNFPYLASTGTVLATVNDIQIAVIDQSPGSLMQGTTNVALMRLQLWSDKNPISLSSLAVKRLGSGLDSDAANLKIYRDADGDGLLGPATDTLVTSGADALSFGAATLAFNTPQSITASTATYFIAVSVAPNAVPGNTLGVSVSTTAAFAVNSPNRVSTATAAFPLTAGPTPINQYPNVVSVTTTSLTPGTGADPGAQNVAVLKLALKTDLSSAQWLSLRLDRGGSSSDADVSAVKVWYDINALGVFDPASLGQYLLVTSSITSFGTQGVPGSVLLAFTAPQGLAAGSKSFFVTVDVATGATPGGTVVVRATDQSYFTVNAPNSVAPTAFSAAPLAITAPPSLLQAVISSSAPATAVQGSANIVMSSLGLWMRAYTGQISQITVVRTGAGQDSDITRVRLYQDTNGNGALNVGADVQLTSAVFSAGTAVLSFPAVTVTASTQTFFVVYDISPTAASGDTVGASVPTPGSIAIAAPNSVSATGFPLASGLTTLVPTQNGVAISFQDRAPANLLQASTNVLLLSLTMNTTSQLVAMSALAFDRTGTASDTDIARLRVYLDDVGDGTFRPLTNPQVASAAAPFITGHALISLLPVQLIAPPPAVHYFVAVDVADFATPGVTFGLSLVSTAAVSVVAPNFVVNANFPMTSSPVPIVKIPDTVTFTATSLLTSNVIQGALVPVARLSAVSSRQAATWTQLRLGRTGSLADASITSVRVYRDLDGSGTINAGDLQVGAGTFASGLADIVFSSVQTPGTSAQGYLVALQLDVNATIGATLGVTLADLTAFNILAPDLKASSSLPFQTAQVTVLDAHTPTQPVVTLAAAPYSSDFEKIDFTWDSSVAIGFISSVQYAIGTTPGGAQLRPWTAIPAVPGAVRADGLLLNTGTTYYVSVQATSNTGFASVPGVGTGELVDTLHPGRPFAPSVSVGQTTAVLSWSPVTSGPSGLRGYLIEYERRGHPVWLNARTGAETGLLSLASVVDVSSPALVSSIPAAVSHLPSGTLSFRVTAVSNAGLLSDPSDITTVQYGPLATSPLSNTSIFPNPVDSRKGAATIVFDLPAPAEVKVGVYTIFGTKAKAFSMPGQAGTNTFAWDATGEGGGKLPKGVYILLLEVPGGSVKLKAGVIH